jgi:hypothetical protein
MMMSRHPSLGQAVAANFTGLVASALRRTNWPEQRTRLQDAADRRTSLDFAGLPWYEPHMIKCTRNVNFSHMTRFGWAVEGVVR